MQTKTRITTITAVVSLAISALPAMAHATATPSAATCRISLDVYQDESGFSKLGEGATTCTGAISGSVVEAVDKSTDSFGSLGTANSSSIPFLRNARLRLSLERVQPKGITQSLGLATYLRGGPNGVITGTARVARHPMIAVGTARFVPDSQLGHICIVPVPELQWRHGKFEIVVKLIDRPVHPKIAS